MPKINCCRLLMSFLPYLFVLVGFPASTWAMGVTLAWDPSPSSDVSGYRLYYKIGYSGAPYDGTDAYEGDSPIDVGDMTTCTVSGLDSTQTYYFVVTAYNAEAESGPSNEVSTADDSGGGSGGGSGSGSGLVQGASSQGGGGGGGGCFINTAADGNFKGLLACLIPPLSLLVLSFRKVWRRIHK
jgi:hypothetical protein